jgi:hypothetical protein
MFLILAYSPYVEKLKEAYINTLQCKYYLFFFVFMLSFLYQKEVRYPLFPELILILFFNFFAKLPSGILPSLKATTVYMCTYEFIISQSM